MSESATVRGESVEKAESAKEHEESLVPKEKEKSDEDLPGNLSKGKRKRKSTVPKLHTEKKNENQASLQKQTKLTHLWKASNGLSESLSKNNISGTEMLKRKIEEDIESKNKLIQKIKGERDAVQKKYTNLVNDNINYRSKARNIIRENMMELAKMKRKQRAQINPSYGYFKDHLSSGFVEGPFLKDLKEKIQKKMIQIEEVKEYLSGNKKNNETWKFKERYLSKELQEMAHELKEREKTILEYKERLKFAQKESNCLYSKLGWPLVMDRFQTLELLGSGGFGEVYKCYDLNENAYVALKQNRLDSSCKNEEYKAEFLKHVNRQIKILKNLHHPNIAKLVEIIKIDQSEVSFILEHCSGPELSKYLKKNTCLQEKQAKQIIRQILFALKYMYEQDNKIIHYDLKPSNIIFHHGVVKVLDFGLCKQMETDDTKMHLTSQGVGTYWYLPPQTFKEFNSEVSSKVDVWSVGVIFYELLYGKRPFGHGISQAKIFNEGIILKATKVEFPAQTPLKYKVSEAAKKFITQCLKYEQKDRLNPDEAYNHQYFK